jgi:hypothetical protein
MNEEKNATREQAIQNNARGAKNVYKLARTKERRLSRKKASTKRLQSRLSDIEVFRKKFTSASMTLNDRSKIERIF